MTNIPPTSRRDAMKLVAGTALVPLVPLRPASAAEAGGEVTGLGRDQPFDRGWRFCLGAGEGRYATAFDDSSWREVHLPHDWSVEDIPPGPGRVGPFDAQAEGGASTGYTLGGEGWYRKRFRLDRLPPDRRAEICFDGVYMVSDVWLNGQLLGTHAYGYTPFAFDLTPHLREGENVLAVRVRNQGQTSRWYSGSGIYRPVTIDVFAQEARISRWGVGAWTRRITDAGAEVDIATRIESPGTGLALRTRLIAPDGAVAAEHVATAAGLTSQSLVLSSPRLWSPADPALYTLESELISDGKVIDRISQAFGVRIVAFDPDQGMSINGVATKLRGGCVHHDNGILGARAFPDAERRRIALLKARGFNAIRSSHNPPSRAFLQACDEQGMLVISEAFDMWHAYNKPQDYSNYFRDRWQTDLSAMVLSARNHASVIMWSIGNEIAERGTREGLKWSWLLSNEVRRLDPTRPVTAGIHSFVGRSIVAGEGTARQGFAGQVDETSSIFLDVVGYNYKLPELDAIHARHPKRIIYASETHARDVFNYAKLMRQHPWFLGEFVWTAMDYLGEAGIGATVRHPPDKPKPLGGAFPWINAFCGDIDLIGQQKPQSRARDVAWGISPLEMLVVRPMPNGHEEHSMAWGWPDELPSWTWPGHEGQRMTVRLYTSGDRVELSLNGKLVGTKVAGADGKPFVEFSVLYEPGVLTATAYRGASPLGKSTLATASAPAQLRLQAESPEGRRRDNALSYIAVEVLDAAGRVAPEAKVPISLRVDGPGELIAFGSASPFASGSFVSNVAESWNGRALAIVRSTGAAGVIRLLARSSGLRASRTQIHLS